MCYWRRLSKRSTNSNSTQFLSTDEGDEADDEDGTDFSLATGQETTLKPTTTTTASTTADSHSSSRRQGRKQRLSAAAEQADSAKSAGQMSDTVNLFRALQVRQERDPDAAPYYALEPTEVAASREGLLCYRRAEVLAFMLTTVSVLLVAISVTIGCCWRNLVLRVQSGQKGRLMAGGSWISSPTASTIGSCSLSSPPSAYGGALGQLGASHQPSRHFLQAHLKGSGGLAAGLHHSARLKDCQLMAANY